jgi:elongation factor G
MAGIEPTPQPASSARIRNVVLLGHGGTGKTALAEALLAVAGAADERGGILDHEPEERERGHSLSLGLASFAWQDHVVNLIDCPGGPDAIGDAFPALRAADVAVFVVDATAGIQPQHDQLWAACDAIGLPRIVVMNKLGGENAAFQDHIDAMRQRYGTPLAPVHMPLGIRQDFTGVIDLLHEVAVTKVGGERIVDEIPGEHRDQATRNREALVEAIVEVDDGLLERYLEGEVPDTKELGAVFARGIATCGFFPVLCVAVDTRIGVRLLADFLVEECPSPVERDPEAVDRPCAIYVAKTLSDPYVGRINVFRVLQGELRTDDRLIVHRTGTDVRLHQLFKLRGKEQQAVNLVRTGDIAAVSKLDDVVTGDVLHTKHSPVVVEPVPPPEPFHRVAIQPESAGDEDKLSTALQRLSDEDPSLRVERDNDAKQVVLCTYGPGHVDVTVARMKRKFGVSVRQVPRRINYRETLRDRGTGLGRHVKQSGGHGQYGIAHVEVEPLPRGGGFEFVDNIVGGVIPNQFIPSVEKGVQEAMAQGVLAGYPVVDVKARLFDGKHHSVDSSQVAFEIAGSLGFRAAAEQAGVVLLEPIMTIEVTVPDDLTGDVMGDLSARRGRIQGTDQAVPGRTTVVAQVPEAEVTNYTAELRSLSSGTGTMVLRYSHHEEVPDNIARRVIQAAEEEKANA